MTTRRLFLTFALFASLLCSKASATLWQGTVTETLTSTTDPRNTVGSTFTGTYEYESDTIDGTFYPWHDHSYFTATLFTFNPSALNGGVVDDAYFWYTRHLTVSDGQVTDFWMEGQTWYDFGFSISEFGSHYDIPPGSWPRINNEGTMSFSAPVAVPEQPLNTGNYVVLSLVFLALIKGLQKRRTQLKCNPAAAG